MTEETKLPPFVCMEDYLELLQQKNNLKKENEKLKADLKTSFIKGMRHFANKLKEYDRTEGSWTDYFEHSVDEVLKRELKS